MNVSGWDYFNAKLAVASRVSVLLTSVGGVDILVGDVKDVEQR